MLLMGYVFVFFDHRELQQASTNISISSIIAIISSRVWIRLSQSETETDLPVIANSNCPPQDRSVAFYSS
jgi:hypothetical protein